MKCRCIDHDCQSVQQAVEVIERYEAILGEATQERKKGNVRNIEQSQQPQNPDPNISSILKKLDTRLERLESVSLAQQLTSRDTQQWRQHPVSRNRKCFFCSSPDHMIKNCPEKARQNPRQRYSGPSSTQPQDNNTSKFQGQRNAIPLTDRFQQSHTHLNPQQFQFDPQATTVQGNASLSTQ